jgi:Cu+-exporting ATPase
MDVETQSSTIKSDYEGETYHFCCAGCKKEFEKEPERYIREKRSEKT